MKITREESDCGREQAKRDRDTQIVNIFGQLVSQNAEYFRKQIADGRTNVMQIFENLSKTVQIYGVEFDVNL